MAVRVSTQGASQAALPRLGRAAAQPVVGRSYLAKHGHKGMRGVVQRLLHRHAVMVFTIVNLGKVQNTPPGQPVKIVAPHPRRRASPAAYQAGMVAENLGGGPCFKARTNNDPVVLYGGLVVFAQPLIIEPAISFIAAHAQARQVEQAPQLFHTAKATRYVLRSD
jgi:hypothetical protein